MVQPILKYFLDPPLLTNNVLLSPHTLRLIECMYVLDREVIISRKIRFLVYFDYICTVRPDPCKKDNKTLKLTLGARGWGANKDVEPIKAHASLH